MYHVEQVVKCRVTSCIPASRRINLSFLMTPARFDSFQYSKLGLCFISSLFYLFLFLFVYCLYYLLIFCIGNIDVYVNLKWFTFSRQAFNSPQLNLNFKFISTDRVSEDDVVKPGTLISGVVERVTPNKIIISVDVNGYTKGTLSPEHLADNQGIKWLLLFITHFGHLLFFFFVY